MKRPFAVIGFSMLLSALIFYNIDFKSSVALTIGVAVIFCLILAIKPFRRLDFIKGILIGILIFSIPFINCQADYIEVLSTQKSEVKIHGVVCQAPTHTDYNHIYIIKLFDNNYKVRYISEDNRFFEEGEIVRGVVANPNSEEFDIEYLESSLSSKIYFSYFETDEHKLSSTGVYSKLYKALGQFKNAFTNLTYEYLPSENGGIANAMVIGDRQGITNATMEIFNYAGTSHLLVVSGMHLSIWGFGVIKLLQKHSATRNHSAVISMAVLLLYSALTGFSVSVVRSMVMVGALIISKALKRDADSLNSVGLGCAVILVANPFSAYSVSLWFTVLSTVGILVLNKPFEEWIYKTYLGSKLSRFAVFKFIITASTVTLSAGVCTLPVFVVAFDTFPWASVFTNILTGDASMLIMWTTIFGAVCHLLGLYPLANLGYTLSGALGEFITLCARKIGLAEWSSLSTSHIAFKYFVVFALVLVVIAYCLKKKYKNIIKTTAVVLVFIFVFISIATAIHDYRTPTVELFMAGSGSPIVHINYKGESVVFITDTIPPKFTKSALNRHNKKIPEQLVILKTDDSSMTDIIYFQEAFYCSSVAFADDGISSFESNAKNIKQVTLGGNFETLIHKSQNAIEFIYGNKKVLFIFDSNNKNDFENAEMYDIIIVCDQIADGETVSLEF